MAYPNMGLNNASLLIGSFDSIRWGNQFATSFPSSNVSAGPGLNPNTLRAIGPDDDFIDAVMDRLYGQHAGKAVVPCQHCGQWAARFCSCKKCGAPVD